MCLGICVYVCVFVTVRVCVCVSWCNGFHHITFFNKDDIILKSKAQQNTDPDHAVTDKRALTYKEL